MKDYKSLTCLEIKKILKKHKVCGYSKLCKQELVKLAKKTLNNKKIKKGGAPNPNPNNNVNNIRIELKDKLNKEKKEFYASLRKLEEPHDRQRIIFFLDELLDKRNCKKYKIIERLRVNLLEEIENIKVGQIHKKEEELRQIREEEIKKERIEAKERNKPIRISQKEREDINSLFSKIQTDIGNLLNSFADYCDSL